MNKLFFLLSILLIVTNSCKKIERVNPKDGIAGVTTSEAKQLDLSTVQISSSLTTTEGVPYVTQRGICWSTSPNPTTKDNFTNEGSGFGTFMSFIKGLEVNTTYYFRAFASNEITTTYGNEVVYKINGPVITTKTSTEVTYTTAKSCRLPTEAEWEYACRAGTTTPFNTGNNLNTSQANYDGNYPYNGGSTGVILGKTQIIGSYLPNAWELNDMHGNVWEWCNDWYGNYGTGIQTNPTGPNTGTNRVRRGGSWLEGGRLCRSSFRGENSPSYGRDNLGFRLVVP